MASKFRDAAESLVIVFLGAELMTKTSQGTSTSTAEFNEFVAILVLTRPSEHCPCIYLSIQASFRPFQAVNRAKIAKTWQGMLENTLSSQCMLGDRFDDVIGDPGSADVQTNQRA